MEQNQQNQQNTIQQTENFGEIIGLLKKKNIKFGTNAETQKNYANGSIEVEVANEFGTSVIKVDVMQMELKKDGESNKAYKALQTINNEYKSIDEHDADQADLIQVFVKLEENNYYLDGEVKEGMKLLASTNFDKKVFTPISRVSDKTTPHKANISFGGMITKVTTNDNTGEVRVEMVGASYSGKAIKHKMDVSKELAQSFTSVYNEGCVTTLHYMPINAVEVQEVKQEVAFGTAPTYSITNTTRKNLVCGGEAVKYDSTMTIEIVKQMLAMREVALTEVKDKALAKQGASQNTNANGFGGNTNSNAGGTPFGGGVPTGNPFGAGGVPSGNPFGQ